MTQLLGTATRGIFPICPTPFLEDGEIDYEGLDRLVDWYASCDIGGLVSLGIFGEAAKLSPNEGEQVLKRVIGQVAGRFPVVVGTGNLRLRDFAGLADASMAAGAAGLMLAPTPGVRTDEEIVADVSRILATIGPGVPIMLQDYPPANDVFLSVPVICRLIAEFEQIVVFKNEDNPGLGKLARIREMCAKEGIRRISILSGRGALFASLALIRGADGVASGFAYPEILVEVFNAVARGDNDMACDLYDIFLPLICHELQPKIGVPVRKYILYKRGLLASPLARPPAPTITDADKAEIDFLMERTARKCLKAGVLPNVFSRT